MIKAPRGVELFYYHELNSTAKLHAQDKLETQDQEKLKAKVYTCYGQPYTDVEHLHIVMSMSKR